MSTVTTKKSHHPASFAELGLKREILQAIAEVGFKQPMPVQAQTNPVLLAGRDAVVQAQTGTGKTAAFAIPLLEKLQPNGAAPQALVLTPTRELALQVAEAIHHLGRYQETRVLALYGGQPIDRQLRALRQPVDVIVGTPGRIMDHLQRGTLHLGSVRMVILDEADEMLDMGFLEDVEWIINHVPAERQTALFSATIPPRIRALAQQALRHPVQITIEPRVAVPQIRQFVYNVTAESKVFALARILDYEYPSSAIIFVRTKNGVDHLVQKVQSLGYSAEAIHGDLSQAMRDRALQRFRTGQATLLIATDVAARGLDIPIVSHVVNFDIPSDPESYIHRIGRTGRAGAQGTALTLVEAQERWLLRLIERTIGQRLILRTLPSPEEIAIRRRERLGQSLLDILSAQDLTEGRQVVEQLLPSYGANEIAAAAILLLLRGHERELSPCATRGDQQQMESNMVRLHLEFGRKHGLHPSELLRKIQRQTGLRSREIGQIMIGERSTQVEIPAVHAQQVETALRESFRRDPLSPRRRSRLAEK